ncbi:MAG: ATP12 family chaperone protein [Xanthobacteraceae bacterium]
MRDIFDEIYAAQPLDPTEATRRSMRTPRRQRFYDAVSVTGEGADFAILLDGRPVRTPARRALVAPSRALAQALAGEWEEQRDFVEPARMPLTRLANSIIDGVVDAPGPVAEEIANYLGSDLVLYRAGNPEGLVARQALHWDPVLAFARDVLGARFVLAEGITFVAQPPAALAAARAAIPTAAGDVKEIWRLGALYSVTTLTGSALIALALLRGYFSVEAAWVAAHVDEDWNMDQWGRDVDALARRAVREAEMRAAATVLALL